jgi:hypothetical protein
LATALIQTPLAVPDVKVTALTAVHIQEPPLNLDRTAFGAEPLDFGLGLAIGAEAGFAALAAAVVLGGFHTKKSVDREAPRGYKLR